MSFKHICPTTINNRMMEDAVIGAVFGQSAFAYVTDRSYPVFLKGLTPLKFG